MSLDWVMIGAVGEILGAVAVLATLLYLARQVSGTRVALRRQANQDVNATFNAIHHHVAASPELAAVVAKVEAGEELTPTEFVQFRSLMLASFNALENMHAQVLELRDSRALRDVEQIIATFFERPMAADIWELHRDSVRPQFRALVESVLAGA